MYSGKCFSEVNMCIMENLIRNTHIDFRKMFSEIRFCYSGKGFL